MLMLRSTHDALMAAKDENIVVALDDRDHWQRRYERLLDKYEAHLTAKAAPPVIVPRVKREPDAVDGAIEWVAQGDVPKRRYLERWAKGERAKGREVSVIADEIMRGHSTDGTDDDGVPG